MSSYKPIILLTCNNLYSSGANITDVNHKPSNSLHRQTSLPSSWAISAQTPRSSRSHHRHTDPGRGVSTVINSMCVGSDIEEGDHSESLKAGGMDASDNRVPAPSSVQDGKLHKDVDFRAVGSAAQPDCSLDSSDSLPSSNENSDSYLLPVMVTSDSGAHKSDDCAPINQAVSVVVTSEKQSDPNRFSVANGKVASDQACSDAFNENDLDMTVQSGQLTDAPLLPPRTYRAPPLPPRVNKGHGQSQTSPPPLPPRHNMERAKKKAAPPPMSPDVSSSLDPPPLPPRTYSPSDVNDSSDSGEGSGGATISGRDSSREQELFPWGDSPQPPHPGLRGHSGTPLPHQVSPTTLSGPPAYDAAGSASYLAMVPPVTGANSAQPGPQLPLRPGSDNDPGSRGSVAWSTISDPPITTSQLADSGHPKRCSVDDIGASAHPPQLQPRQIRRHLEQWYREKQKNSPTNNAPTPEGQSPSASTSTSENARNTPPPLPPSLSPVGATAAVRTPDCADGIATSLHSPGTSNTAQPQVPTSSSSSALPSMPSSRDRSNDRRGQS